MTRNESDAGCLSVLSFLGVIAMLVFWIVSSRFEAAAFNRATGKNVSTWDAMWIELRVQAAPE